MDAFLTVLISYSLKSEQNAGNKVSETPNFSGEGPKTPPYCCGLKVARYG